MKIVINLSPSDVKNRGSHFDLGMAIALLIQLNQIKTEEIDNYAFIGELSLNVDLRPCNGVLPMVMEAKNRGMRNVVVPHDNRNFSPSDFRRIPGENRIFHIQALY